jgi:hypothetical protein
MLQKRLLRAAAIAAAAFTSAASAAFLGLMRLLGLKHFVGLTYGHCFLLLLLLLLLVVVVLLLLLGLSACCCVMHAALMSACCTQPALITELPLCSWSTGEVAAASAVN